jgi:hypothetical protein
MTTTTPRFQVGDRVQLTVDIKVMFTNRRKGEQGVIRKTAPWGGLHMLRMHDGRTVFAHPHEITRIPATTAAEFARDHGNDSSNWTPADIECEQILATLDLHRACPRTPRTPTPTDHAPAA